MTSAAFTDILCARSATVIVSGTETSRMSGSGAGAFAASPSSSPSSWRCLPPLRLLPRASSPCRRLTSPRNFRRAAARRFFLERGRGRLARAPCPSWRPAWSLACAAFLRSSFAAGFASATGCATSLGRLRGGFRSRLGRSFLGFLLLLGLALLRLLLLLAARLPAAWRSAPRPCAPLPRARATSRPRPPVARGAASSGARRGLGAVALDEHAPSCAPRPGSSVRAPCCPPP